VEEGKEGDKKYGTTLDDVAMVNVESVIGVAGIDVTSQSDNTSTSGGGTLQTYPGFSLRLTCLRLENLVKRRVKFTLVNMFPPRSSDLTHGLALNCGRSVRFCPKQSNSHNLRFSRHRVQKVRRTNRNNKINALAAMTNLDL
jgi:hypothetical protein